MFPPFCPFFFVRLCDSHFASRRAKPGSAAGICASRDQEAADTLPAGRKAPAEGWQSGRMRRSRKPFRAVSSDEGSNPSPSSCLLLGPNFPVGIELAAGAGQRALDELRRAVEAEAAVPRHGVLAPEDDRAPEGAGKCRTER